MGSQCDMRMAVVGNGQYSFIIDHTGSVVWGCLPRPDADPVFCALLRGKNDTSFFDVELARFGSSEQYYERNTACLTTCLWTENGDSGIKIQDCAPMFTRHDRKFRPNLFMRRISPIKGRPRIRIRLRPTFGYGWGAPETTRGSNHVRFLLPTFTMRLTTDAPVAYVLSETMFSLEQPVTLMIMPDESLSGSPADTFSQFFTRTSEGWCGWVRRLGIPFEYQPEVIRAAITLKMSLFEETGAILAALTTSIPPMPHSGLNYDMRFCWLRDSYFVVHALSKLGATEVMEKYLEYLANVVSDFHSDEELRAVRQMLTDAAGRASALPPLTRQGSRSAPQTRAGSPMPRGREAPAVMGRPTATRAVEGEAAQRALRSMPSSPRREEAPHASQAMPASQAPPQVVTSTTGGAGGGGEDTPWGIGPQEAGEVGESTPLEPTTATTHAPGSVGATVGDSGLERSTPSTTETGDRASAVRDGPTAAAGGAGEAVEEGPATRPSQLPAHVDVELQPVYGLAREVNLDERVLSRLPGYRRMGPVRVGNANAGMLQNGVYGSVVLAATHLFFDQRLQRQGDVQLFEDLCFMGRKAIDVYQRADAGPWAIRRDGATCKESLAHTMGAVMCWATCDRLAKIATHLKLPAAADEWRGEAEEIRREIDTRAWDSENNTYLATLSPYCPPGEEPGSGVDRGESEPSAPIKIALPTLPNASDTVVDEAAAQEQVPRCDDVGDLDVDAALLLMPELGYIPASDPRFRGTVAAIEQCLCVNGLLFRTTLEARRAEAVWGKWHRRQRGKAPSEQPAPAGASSIYGASTVCTFWYIDALSGMGRHAEARKLFENLMAKANHVGLLAECVDPFTGEAWGNFPQTAAMVGLINSAMRISKSWQEAL